MKTKFLSACIGIAAVLFALGFFIQSINPARAQTNVGNNNTDSKAGRYQMCINSFVLSNVAYYRVLVYDTETGKSKMYINSSNYDGGWVVDDQNLPANPLN